MVETYQDYKDAIIPYEQSLISHARDTILGLDSSFAREFGSIIADFIYVRAQLNRNIPIPQEDGTYDRVIPRMLTVYEAEINRKSAGDTDNVMLRQAKATQAAFANRRR